MGVYFWGLAAIVLNVSGSGFVSQAVLFVN